MSAFPESGRSNDQKDTESSGSFRPKADTQASKLNVCFGVDRYVMNVCFGVDRYVISLGSCESTSTIGATRSLLERHSEALAQSTVAGLTKISSGANNYISAYESHTLRRRKRVLVEH